LLFDVTCMLVIHSVLELVFGVRLLNTGGGSLKHADLLRHWHS
jgi:hypothetical protein